MANTGAIQALKLLLNTEGLRKGKLTHKSNEAGFQKEAWVSLSFLGSLNTIENMQVARSAL